MNPKDKKTALRMIPYGLFVLTGQAEDGRVAAATVNWVTQASFDPPLVAVGVKVGSGAHAIIREAGAFALNVLGKGQQDTAVVFFKPVEREGNSIGGEIFRSGNAGAPILENCPAHIECRLVGTRSGGDHDIFVGEVVDAEVRQNPEGRPDGATLVLADLGGEIFYGG